MELPETRDTLLAAAHRRFGRIPADLIVDHVLAVTRDADFAVREAALEALHRRWEFARRDELSVASRPRRGAALGLYATARKGKGRGIRDSRPYQTLLESVRPVAGSCDCADFIKSSLGLCKHLLVILDDIHATKAKTRAVARQRSALDAGPWLRWDPLLPLSGELDRLTGLEVAVHAGVPKAAVELLGAFPNGRLEASVRGDPERRREILARVARALEGSARLGAAPAARALVMEELAAVDRRLRCARDAGRVLSELRSLRRKLYPYQRDGIARLLEVGRLLLADDMGLGKTTQAVAACHALHRAGRVRRGVVVAPASLKSQWLREWQETTDTPAVVVDGPPADRARQYRSLRSGFVIIGYEQLLRDIAEVQALRPEIVVLDEAQRIKNYATKSAVTVKALTPEYRLVLTGTPMENRLEELASILDWVDDLAMAPKWRIVPWYTSWDGDGGSTGRAGARNLDTLRARLRPSVVRRVRKEVIAQLPKRTDTRVPVQMTPQQAEEHFALNQPVSALVHTARRRPLTQGEFLRLMQLLNQQRIIANGLGQLRFDEVWPTYQHAEPDDALLAGLFAPKLLELRRLITDLVVEQERKVVVFSQWRRMLRLAEWSLRDVLKQSGARCVFFTGAEKPAQRTRNVVDFHDDPRVPLMFLSDAGGVGLNLQRAANACINLELPWNPAVLEQRVGRIYRLGQKSPVDVYNLVSDASIEARIADLLSAKQALFSSLFDGSSDAVRFDAAPSFLTRVERLVELDPPSPASRGATAQASGAEDEDEDLSPPSDDAEPALGDEVGPALVEATATAPASAIPTLLFDALRIERTPSGGVRIEAPPEAAESLIALFQGMAKLLAASAVP
ncbi:MAG: DEAD/DEAH box helicase family protein [Myxococcales bacterium]|nr:DEAD/DEAH box helicase family protein [Myxococcales bacterium]